MAESQIRASLRTEVLKINPANLRDPDSPDSQTLQRAAHALRTSDVPVAFPTETVYGLGADATRSSAVQGIYRAKQRPADNPLIVHIHSLEQLRNLLRPNATLPTSDNMTNATSQAQDRPDQHHDPIPPIYHPLIQGFWPGPLTLILPLPQPSTLAPEVCSNLPTFGARMPSSPLALALIRAADRPIAAPSANSSSKPSPTRAEHVLHDLNGRVELILDGGACDVGVESTVVNGLCTPPVVLRPGGVGLEELRQCEGWADVRVGYRDVAQGSGKESSGGQGADGSESGRAPMAPGMKYRHYSPRARVVLVEAGGGMPGLDVMAEEGRSVGIIRTQRWKSLVDGEARGIEAVDTKGIALHGQDAGVGTGATTSTESGPENVNGVSSEHERLPSDFEATKLTIPHPISGSAVAVWDAYIGLSVKEIARGLFSALRQLDLEKVDVIYVEGIDDEQGDIAAAVMNRLRKAAEVKLTA